jgi:hypothetical protein
MANPRRNLAALSSSFVTGTHWLSIIEPENPTRVNPVSYKYIRHRRSHTTVTYSIRFKPSGHHGLPANLTQANVGSEECPWFFLLDECTDDFQCAQTSTGIGGCSSHGSWLHVHMRRRYRPHHKASFHSPFWAVQVSIPWPAC